MAHPHLANALIPPPLDGETTDQLVLMLAGEPYLSSPYLRRIRNAAAIKLDAINRQPDGEARMRLWKDHAVLGEKVFIVQHFFCEYGFNCHFSGDNFIGANCTFLDMCQITIGRGTMCGPDVKIYTADHPLSPEARSGGPEWGKPVTIEEDCWIGGGVVIVPGVTIGRGSTIGAGSVVTKDVPPRSVAVGNPARVIKHIEEDGTVVAGMH